MSADTPSHSNAILLNNRVFALLRPALLEQAFTGAQTLIKAASSFGGSEPRGRHCGPPTSADARQHPQGNPMR